MAATSGRRNFLSRSWMPNLTRASIRPIVARISSASSPSMGDGGQPPGEGKAEGLDGDPIAAGDRLAERGQGRGRGLPGGRAAALARR